MEQHLTEIWVKKDNFAMAKTVAIVSQPLPDGAVKVALNFAALTANNVSYAFSGNTIGYWGFFPTGDDAWGKVPIWGYGTVIESSCPAIPEGERLYGFWPMASHVILEPVGVKEDRLMDGAAHRQSLPPLYNAYFRTAAEPAFLADIEKERALYFPLFITSYLLADYLVDNQAHGARQVFVSSVSSKTGFGLAQMLQDMAGDSLKVVGLTSKGNVDFVEGLGCCDQIVVYGNEEQDIDASIPAAFVDMTGSAPLTQTLHTHMQDNMVCSLRVGATHWEKAIRTNDLPGAEPVFFFAPSQVAKRDKEWGKGVVVTKAMIAAAKAARAVQGQIQMTDVRGAEAICTIWQELVKGDVDPRHGILMAFD